MKFPSGRLNLYVIEIGEPAEDQLRVVIAIAVLGEPIAIAFGDVDLGEGRPIEITNSSERLEITWNSYVAYAVRNESYWAREEGEPDFTGHLTQREGSALLRYVSETTFASDDFPGPLQHWALTTLNHCVDVVSVEPPTVASLGRGRAFVD